MSEKNAVRPRLRRIAVFCGSSRGTSPACHAATAAFARACAARQYGVVYGGGRVGLMGLLADSALAAGTEVIGVIPEFLSRKEIRHDGLTRLEVVPTMHARKALIAELSDAFVALPGGLGTLDELCEILTWSQLGLHNKPVGVLNVGGYFDPLLALLDRAVADGFCRAEHRRLFCSADVPEELLDRLESFERPALPKWLDLEQT
jgi:uncharacterized protein (TIGR00730 family)